MSLRMNITLVLLLLAIVGSGIIVYQGRPVMNALPPASSTPSISNDEEKTSNQFAMEEIEQHSTKEDCWSVINGQVYDLSTWVSRHPGGSQAIISLCGKDGSDRFNTQHGTSRAAQNMLTLLRIGSLK